MSQENHKAQYEILTKYFLKCRENFEFKTEIIWGNVILFVIFHVAAFYGLFLLLTIGTWKTLLWTYLLVVTGNVGITAGAHRLWSHRTYKANLPLRVILMVFQTMGYQKSIYEWVRDHRVHHKYTHTDADPHNPERGYFFAHIGWLMMKKHRDVLIKGSGIDISDVEADPIVKFQRKYYAHLVILTGFLFPAMVPWYFWDENLWVCWFGPTFFRFVCTLNITLLINSMAHAWGLRAYDKTISPADNAFVSFLATGEGWHNYHHVFPWDYKTGEFGSYRLNFTTLIIDFFSVLGWAYDMKTASVDMIKNRKKRTGGDRMNYTFLEQPSNGDGLWGWGDTDMKSEEIEEIKIYNKLLA